MGLAQALGWTGVNDWIDPRRNTLIGLGAGLLQGKPGAYVMEGRMADNAYATQQKAEAERQSNINQTAQWARSQFPELSNAPDALVAQMAPKLWENKFLGGDKQSLVNAGNGMIYDPNTGKWITAPGQDGSANAPYEGTSMDAQNWNILITGDPNSPEYAAAYSQLSQPKMTMQQTEQGLVPVWTTPQLPSNIRPPAGMSAVPSGGAPGPGGAVTTGSAIPGTKKPPTEQRARAQMMDSVISPEIETLLGDGTAQNPGTMDALNSGWDVVKDATGTAGRFAPFGIGTPSENYLKAKNAVRTLIASYLYVASGATANPGEVENQAAILTPQVGDPPDVVAGKKARIKVMADAVKALARGESVDLNAVMAGGVQPGGVESTGDPELDRALQQYGG